MQIFIYEKIAFEGHSLHSVDFKFIQVQYEHYVYLIWKVNLIEDIPV